jgi:CRP/FNR family cyclic AMP-dependent transcriptional regulator
MVKTPVRRGTLSLLAYREILNYLQDSIIHPFPMSSDLNQPELPAIGFVADISDEDRLVLSGYGEFLPVQDEQVLIQEGQDQNCLYFIISGRLHVTTEDEGRRTLLGRLGPGDLVGEVNVFDPQKASATVMGMEFSQVWRMDRAMLDAFTKDSPAAASQLLIHISTQLSQRLRETNEKVTFIRKTLGRGSF